MVVTGEGVAGKKVDCDELGNREDCGTYSHSLGCAGKQGTLGGIRPGW